MARYRQVNRPMSTDDEANRPLVLLVEPEWPTRAYLNAALAEVGFQVHPTESARDAVRWELTVGDVPRVIVLDVGTLHADDLLAARQLVQLVPSAALLLLARPTVAVDPILVSRAREIVRRPFSIGYIVARTQALASAESGQG